MSLMARYSDTDINQAALMSRLSGCPAQVHEDVFVWNGKLIDRASAIVALLKVYNQVPVSSAAKKKLYSQYVKKFAKERLSMIISEDDDKVEIWFYKLCKIIKGTIEQRANSDVKQILISLHRS